MSDLFSFSNRVALVTGGGSGLGEFIAKGLATAGAARVYITGRRVHALERVAQAASGKVVPIVGDVSTIDGCKQIADAFVVLEKKAGVKEVQLDLLVNNAGVFANEGLWEDATATAEQIRDALLQASDTDWARVFATNVAAIQASPPSHTRLPLADPSLQWLSAALLPYLVKAAKENDGHTDGRGCVINNTSVSAFYVSPHAKGHLYSASKAAAESVTLNLASKFTRLGVRVNSIAPANLPSEINDPSNPQSFIAKNKDIIPIGRIGKAEDAVGAVLYLATAAGSFVSGTCIKIDGGILVGA
ncbi:NAD(P)-binding protein [Obba rivulosa]|uniref:NAD(P)-binding protein n=1 Tax=Obba rivulosa TaxID=1052685 RepID=A0A8E2DM69_9APHY|nr:NAD(P)-binding protein [Obba rivulosa]